MEWSKNMKPNEMILTKTQFGVDRTFKLMKKTKYHPGRQSEFIR